MDIEYSTKLLDILVENCRRIFASGFGIDQAECSMFQVVELLRAETVLKASFLKKVEITFEKTDAYGLDDGSVPRELIELVVHEFQWPEFDALAKKRLLKLFNNNKSLAISDMSMTVQNAYREDWEDKEFYRKYNLSP
ncbi:hypothetical protein PMI07_004666 [Rhizobium sp. CF080]|uniref:hypothetical protein n=1 Tax=Rhizobium sp. (strain CF080) TaxID=1144310 RepID=UPI000271CDB6|nr:hypothetical protein [Rhizobium sp. CF080]EUB98385.1 hypothetical protein PMI07_004666 [Rhizobium sp. CF080]